MAIIRIDEVTKAANVARIMAEEEARVKIEEEAKAIADEKARIIAEELKAAEEAKAAAEQKAAEEEAYLAAQARALLGLKETPEPVVKTKVKKTAKTRAKANKKAKFIERLHPRIWHYTYEGDRVGPISFKELRDRAIDLSLHPRLDLVWKTGMEQWIPAGQIEGLFEHKIQAEKPKITPIYYHLPTQKSPWAPLNKHSGWPGWTRRKFVLSLLLFPFFWNFLMLASASIQISLIGPLLAGYLQLASPLILALFILGFLFKRLQNVGMNASWSLAAVIPILNLWVGYRCFACPSGYAYHKKMDGPGFCFATLYILTFAAGFLYLSSFYFDFIDIPAIQAKLRTIMLESGKK